MTAYLPSSPQSSPTRPIPVILDRTLQRKCACVSSAGPSGEVGEWNRKSEAGVLRRFASHAQSPTLDRDPVAAPPIVHDVLRSPGRPLDAETRAFMEPRFGHDFSRVRIHTDHEAAKSAATVGAQAYTVGRDVVFGPAQYAPETHRGRHLLAHELTHALQQTEDAPKSGLNLGDTGSPAEREADRIAGMIVGPGPVDGKINVASAGLPRGIYRYETGEHAQFGETGDIIRAEISHRAFTYRVRGGETPEKLANRFGIEVDRLKQVNSAKIKKWNPTGSGGGTASRKLVEGFNAGEEITIPPVVNALTEEALKSKELTFTVNGVQLDYGEGITMGDFYEDATQMVNAPASELQALAVLIKKEKSGTPVTTKEWDDATGGRYHQLAEKNESHFAPSNPKLVDVSSAAHGANHQTEWEKYHKFGLDKSRAGAKDEALRVNSFGDHFLTDAFAAGHLVNKRDVMEKFKGGLTKNTDGDYIGDAKVFFDAVAKKSFTRDVKAQFSRHETVDSYNMDGKKDPKGNFHPSINDEGRFSGLLQGIQDTEPDVLANAVAKAVHDSLNTAPKGIPVENANHDKWDLSGDGTLNPRSREIGRKAVAQSQLNILDVFKLTGPLDYNEKFKKVWAFVPYPTGAGETKIKSTVGSGTDLKNASLVNAIVALINANYLLILRELVARGILRRT